METKSRASSLKKKRRVFGWLFLASILVLFASNMLVTLAPMSPIEHAIPPEAKPPINSNSHINPMPSLPPPSQAQSTFVPDTAIIVSVVSLLTSVTSLVGFFFTTMLAWRKEKREALSAELEIKKKELELEKLRGELGRSSEGRNNESA